MAPGYYSCLCQTFPSDTDNSQEKKIIVTWAFYILDYIGEMHS